MPVHNCCKWVKQCNCVACSDVEYDFEHKFDENYKDLAFKIYLGVTCGHVTPGLKLANQLFWVKTTHTKWESPILSPADDVHYHEGE